MDRHGIHTADRSYRAEQPKMSQNFHSCFRFRVIKCQS